MAVEFTHQLLPGTDSALGISGADFLALSKFRHVLGPSQHRKVKGKSP